MSHKDPREVHRRLAAEAELDIAHQRERDTRQSQRPAPIRPLTRSTNRVLLERLRGLSPFERAQLRALPLTRQVALAELVKHRGREWVLEKRWALEVEYAQAAKFDLWDEKAEAEQQRRDAEDG